MHNQNDTLLEKFNCFCPKCMNFLGMVFIGGGYIFYLYLKYYFIYLPGSFLHQSKTYFNQKKVQKHILHDETTVSANPNSN